MIIQIHACKQREVYVRAILIPELKKQGFKCIRVHMDDGKGNLQAYIDSYRELPDTGDVWHLEDDVFPDSRFYDWSLGLAQFPGVIIAGFGAGQYYGLRDFGYCVAPSELFLSFPCIRIPSEVIKDFLRWYDDKGCRDPKAKTGKEIDSLFRDFLIIHGITGFNFRPCIVEHVDDLIGGSIVNPDRIPLKAAIFEGDLSPLESLR